MAGETVPLESVCLQAAQEVLDPIAKGGRKKLKESFKLVNNLLQVLDREGFYAATVYMAAYGKGGTELLLLSQFNSFLKGWPGLLDSGESSGQPRPAASDQARAAPTLHEEVTPENLSLVRRNYRRYFCREDASADIAFLFFRRLLIHLRHELKAAMKNNPQPAREGT